MTQAPSADGAPIRVFLVDDHPMVLMGLEELIEAQGDMTVCGKADSVHEAQRQIEKASPQLAVVDISLKGQNGLELVRALRGSSVKVLVSSMHDDELYAERAIASGAQGYINKQAAPEQLVSAIRSVMAGRSYLSPMIMERVMQRMTSTGQPVAPGEEANLSNRELEIFELLGRGKTIRDIAKQLHISPKTVETHRQNMKGKLAVGTSAELTARAAAWLGVR